MTNDQVEDKDVSPKSVEPTEEDDQAVNVFVHSASGSPEAWSEAEVDSLLVAWRAVLEQSPVKRYDIVRRVLKRLKETEGGFKRLDKLDKRKAKDDVWRQMEALRMEYQVFKGLQKIKGLKAVRHRCVDQLEHIIDRIPQARRTASDVLHSEDSAEDPQARRTRSVSEGESIRSAATRGTRKQDEEAPSSKPRFQQRRMNLTRLVRVMVSQQQTMLEQLEKLFKVLELSSDRMATLAEASVLTKAPPEQDDAVLALFN